MHSEIHNYIMNQRFYYVSFQINNFVMRYQQQKRRGGGGSYCKHIRCKGDKSEGQDPEG